MKNLVLGIRNRSGQVLIETVFVAAFMSVLLLVFGRLADLQRERRLQKSFIKTTEFQSAKK